MQLFIPIHHVHHAPPTQLSSQTALSHFAWNGKRSFVKRLPSPPPRQQSWSPVVLYGSSSGGLYMTSSRQHGPWRGSRNTPNLSYVGLILFWDRRKLLTYILCTSYMERGPCHFDRRVDGNSAMPSGPSATDHDSRREILTILTRISRLCFDRPLFRNGRK